MNPPVSPAVAPDELRVDAPDPLYMSTLAQRPAASAGRVPRGALAVPRAVGVLTGAVAALVESWNGATPFKTAGLVAFALLAGIAVAGREPRWRRLLPLMGALSRAVAPV